MADNPAISISIDTKEAEALLQKMPGVFTKRLFDGLNTASRHVEAEVVSSIAGQRSEPRSVKTGRFMGSVKHKIDGLVGIVSTDVEYAKFLEWGKIGQNPRRHFTNTAAREKDRVRNILAASLKG